MELIGIALDFHKVKDLTNTGIFLFFTIKLETLSHGMFFKFTDWFCETAVKHGIY